MDHLLDQAREGELLILRWQQNYWVKRDVSVFARGTWIRSRSCEVGEPGSVQVAEDLGIAMTRDRRRVME